ncbi:lung seven transmembrane receptor domain-containing protein [Anopheles sinensis]|uniref:Lung seven transmembrane receptor domain-containing protein n=1 Tax=Anopheles sinensis TaxID=74873 RepID=A0A084WS13_ANOSI|nr:lung seven transmembrane receptor domain-containing protein [Anopheles sinensis]
MVLPRPGCTPKPVSSSAAGLVSKREDVVSSGSDCKKTTPRTDSTSHEPASSMGRFACDRELKGGGQRKWPPKKEQFLARTSKMKAHTDQKQQEKK